MTDRISTLDSGYLPGDLSIYPESIDSKDTLYEVKNNAQSVLAQSVNYNTKFIVAEDASSFPESGIILLGEEIIYYANRTNTVFKNLKRGFAGSKQFPWKKGTTIGNAVLAETHNATKDAIINIESYVGLKDNPSQDSLNGILKKQESRFLAPKPLFRAYPTAGAPPLKIRFQNFSGGDPIRFLWDFGDGATSTDESPTHTYVAEGTYTVKLNMITSTGAQGVVIKQEYITVDDNNKSPFFYVSPEFSSTTSQIFTFIDQTDGDITSRYWIFGDGTSEKQEDPDIHITTHQYTEKGEYDPSLLVIFAGSSTPLKVILPHKIIVG